jgi:hypothetical protein
MTIKASFRHVDIEASLLLPGQRPGPGKRFIVVLDPDGGTYGDDARKEYEPEEDDPVKKTVVSVKIKFHAGPPEGSTAFSGFIAGLIFQTL